MCPRPRPRPRTVGHEPVPRLDPVPYAKHKRQGLGVGILYIHFSSYSFLTRASAGSYESNPPEANRPAQRAGLHLVYTYKWPSQSVKRGFRHRNCAPRLEDTWLTRAACTPVAASGDELRLEECVSSRRWSPSALPLSQSRLRPPSRSPSACSARPGRKPCLDRLLAFERLLQFLRSHLTRSLFGFLSAGGRA